MYRRIAYLRDVAGWIQTETDTGIERRIYPLIEQPQLISHRNSRACVAANVGVGVPLPSVQDAAEVVKQRRTQENGTKVNGGEEIGRSSVFRSSEEAERTQPGTKPNDGRAGNTLPFRYRKTGGGARVKQASGAALPKCQEIGVAVSARSALVAGPNSSVSTEASRIKEQALLPFEGKKEPSMSGAVSGVLSGVVSGVLPVIDAYTQDTTTTQIASGVVAELVKIGVTLGVAVQLLNEAGEAELQKQVQALPFRKVQDKAAALVQSIRQRWEVPAAYQKQQQQQQAASQRAFKAVAAAQVASYQENLRAERLARLSGLPVGIYDALQQQAVALWKQEQPAAARIMAGKVAAGPIVQAYMLRLLEVQGVNHA
jgi:hypothetical protein